MQESRHWYTRQDSEIEDGFESPGAAEAGGVRVGWQNSDFGYGMEMDICMDITWLQYGYDLKSIQIFYPYELYQDYTHIKYPGLLRV